MLRTKDIIDEKDKRMRLISEEVKFPLSDQDKEKINEMIKYLHDSQIEELADKYDLRPGMGLSAVQIGWLKRIYVVVHEYEPGKFNNYILINPRKYMLKVAKDAFQLIEKLKVLFQGLLELLWKHMMLMVIYLELEEEKNLLLYFNMN